MIEAFKQKTPVSYWIITLIFLIWNAFGGYDYLMTRTRNIEYLKAMGDPQALLRWIDSFPLWVQICWPVGVWSSILGSLLMLFRSRHAVSAFAVSFVAALASLGYQLGSETPAALNTTANRIMPLVILAIILFLLAYCRRMAGKGVLR